MQRKKLSQITAREFIDGLPREHINTAATAALCLLCMLPLAASMIFYMQKTAAQSDAAHLLLGSLWFQMLAPIGYVCGVLACFHVAKSGRAALPKRGQYRERGLSICLTLVLIWAVISAFCSDNYKNSFLGDAYRHDGILTYLIYACVFAAAMHLNQRQMRMVAECLVGVCALTGLLVIAVQQEIDVPFYLEDVKTLMFHNNNHYGYFLGMCCPLGMTLVLCDDWKRPGCSLLRLAEFWLVCNAAAVNSVRGSFLGMTAALIGWNIVIILLRRENWKQLLVMDGLFLATIGFLNTDSDLFKRLKRIVEDVAAVAEGAEDAVDKMGSGRGRHWRWGIRFALDSPLVGHGPDNLGVLYHAVDPKMTDRPHNELIQIAASLGFPALVFYVAGLWSHIRTFLRSVTGLSLFQVGLFACVGSYLVGSMFGNTMYYTTPYFYMVLGFSYGACRQLKD